MTIKTCNRCGEAISLELAGSICPKCLMLAGFPTDQAASSIGGSRSGGSAAGGGRGPFVPPTVSELAPYFPQFEILELIGWGGMGAVYKVRQIKLDRWVALKLIRPEISHDSHFAARFAREAKTLARLNHPHIVMVHDFGEVTLGPASPPSVEAAESSPNGGAAIFYFVMEYVEGANLRQMLQLGRIKPEQALALVPQICDALQYAHQQGVVHRDIKPENVLVDRQGQVKIADFGLAKLAAHDDAFTLTGTHQAMGTLRYMAPEQMESAHAVDHRADIFSLGVVFYEMLTGQVPAGHFAPPSQKVQVDVRLDEVVLRAMAREPERRYQQASEVKAALESVASPLDSSRVDSSEPTIAQPHRGSQSSAGGGRWAEDERQREAELAEIAPDWLQLPFLGLNVLGWLAVALLWNFEWPGLSLAVTAMAVVTYTIIRWKLTYLPRLQQELGREARWRHLSRLAFGFVFFVGGILSLIGCQVKTADLLTRSHLLNIWRHDDASDRQWVERAVGDAQDFGLSRLRELSFSMDYLAIPMLLLLSLTFLLGAVATVVQTRRYGSTWKHFGGPVLSTVFWIFAALPLIYVGHLMLTGYSSGSSPPLHYTVERVGVEWPEFLENWRPGPKYDRLLWRRVGLMKAGQEAGELMEATYAPRSWFDRYRASWRHLVLRPFPPVHFVLIRTGDEPGGQLFVELPHYLKGSPESEWWNSFVDRDIVRSWAEKGEQSLKPKLPTSVAAAAEDSNNPSESASGEKEVNSNAARIDELLQAAAQGQSSQVMTLIGRGLSVNDKSATGRTALMEAAAAGHAGLVKVLIEEGSSLNEADNRGRTALMAAAETGHDQVLDVIEAAQQKFPDQIRVHVDQQDLEGNTALMLAASQGKTACVLRLTSPPWQASPTLRNLKGRTALMLAVENDRHAMLQQLCEEPQTSVGTAVGNYSYNAFLDPENVALETPDGRNAIELAAELGRSEAQAILRSLMQDAVRIFTEALAKEPENSDGSAVYQRYLTAAKRALGQP